MKQAWYYNMTWLNNPQNNPVATNCGHTGHTCVQGSPQADSFPTVPLLWFKDTRTTGLGLLLPGISHMSGFTAPD